MGLVAQEQIHNTGICGYRKTTRVHRWAWTLSRQLPQRCPSVFPRTLKSVTVVLHYAHAAIGVPTIAATLVDV